MNVFRRITALSLLICMLGSFSVSAETEKPEEAADASVTLTSRQQEVVAVLSALNLIVYTSDEALRLDDSITRAEALTMIMRARRQDQSTEQIVMQDKENEDLFAEQEEESAEAEQLAFVAFSDVSSDHWASRNIETAAKLNIISGLSDGTFAPELSVNYEEAVKMAVNLLGYGLLAEFKGGYPLGYLSIAMETNILSGVDRAMTRGDFFQLLYNSLSVNMLVQDAFGSTDRYSSSAAKNIMAEYMDVVKLTGLITANSYIAIDGTDTAPNGWVVINGEQYNVGKTNASDYVGYTVTVYAHYNELRNEKTIFLLTELERNDTVVITRDLLIDVTGVQTSSSPKIYYYEDDTAGRGRQRIASIATDAAYIYNNKLLTVAMDETLKITHGTLELIDNNKDGVFDLINIREYRTVIVSNVSTRTGTIVDRITGAVIDLDEKNSNVNLTIIKNGHPVELSDLVDWDVLEILESKDTSFGKKRLEAIVLSNPLSGTVLEKSTDEILLDCGRYKVTADFDMNTVRTTDTGTFYRNIIGEIFYYKRSAGNEYAYGYVIKSAYSNSGLNRTVQMQLAGENGKATVLSVSKNARVNGIKPADYGSIHTLIPMRQLIRYMVNDEDEIIDITTAIHNDDSGYDLDNFTMDYDSKGIAYNNHMNRYGEMYTATSDTLVFVVPGKSDTPNLTESKYVKGHISMITTNVLDYKNIEVYDANDNFEVGVLVVYGESTAAVGVEIGGEPVFYVLQSIGTGLTEEDERTYILQYVSSAGVEAKTPLESMTIAFDNSYGVTKTPQTLCPGDVFNFTKNSDGQINNICVYFDASRANDPDYRIYINTERKSSIDKTTGKMSGEVLVHGPAYYTFEEVKRKTSGAIVIDGQKSESEKKEISFRLSGVMVLIYDSARNRVYKGSASDINQGDKIFLYVRWQDPRLLVLFT